MNKRKRRILPIVLSMAVLLTICGILIFTGKYYHADSVAMAALVSDDNVTVTETDYGYFFDGASQDDALILYPGARVETAAYAPLCRELAENGFDVCLADMPFGLALFGINKADKIMKSMDYENWYIAGHSLGGVCASDYASNNSDKLSGVVLLASFTVHKLDDNLNTLLIYGSEDTVLAADRYKENLINVPEGSFEFVIEGGNHAGFGSYGPQDGDGAAYISQEEQVLITANVIKNKIRKQ